MKRHAYALSAVLALAGLSQLAAGAWIHAKGLVAQRLIAASWRRAEHGTAPKRPWPGADLRPIARLTVPRQGIDLYVMDDASRRSLAFGPGWIAGSAAPASRGNTVIVAHRDTHFTFLERVVPGDEIDVQAAAGKLARYRVEETSVVDRTDTEVMEDDGRSRLTLITCYPFHAARPGTRLRYVVVASRVA